MRCPACNAEILLNPKELAALLGARGGAAGRGEAKSRDKGMLSKAGKKGAAVRWGKTAAEAPQPDEAMKPKP